MSYGLAELPEPPADPMLWVMDDPAQARDYLHFVYVLNRLQFRRAKGGLPKLTIGQLSALLDLPVLYPDGVPDDAATYAGGAASATYNQAEITALKTQVAALTTTLNAILAQERALQA